MNLISFKVCLLDTISGVAVVRSLRFFAFLLIATLFLKAQQAAPAPSRPASEKNNPEFLATADEVLKDMSEITGWKLKTPLKKTMRSREEIHAYVLKQMDDEKDAKERYASTRSAEAFGLIPKGFRSREFSGGLAHGTDCRFVRSESARVLYCGLDRAGRPAHGDVA